MRDRALFLSRRVVVAALPLLAAACGSGGIYDPDATVSLAGVPPGGTGGGGGGTTGSGTTGSGTTGSGTGTGGPGDTVTARLNTDPSDPHLMTLQNGPYTAHLFGTKNAQGQPAHVETMVLEDAGQGASLTVDYDALDRPRRMADSKGNQADFTWADVGLVVSFRGPDGSYSGQTIPMSELPGVPAGAAPGGAPGKADAGDRPITVLTQVRLTSNLQPLKALEDARVTGQIDSRPGMTWPAQFDAGLGGYVFRYVHRTQPIDQGKAACENALGAVSTAATHVGTVVAAAALFCALSTAGAGTPFCIWLLSWKGAVLGVAIAGTGSAATRGPGLICSEWEIPADPPQMHVVVVSSHPTYGAGHAAGGFDLSNLSDPVNLGGRLDLTIDYPLKAGVLEITPQPYPPLADQSYVLVFTLEPAGAAVDWSLSGSDGYAQSGRAQAAPGATTATSDSIPGGAAGVTESITARVVVDGTVVGGQTQTVFVFK